MPAVDGAMARVKPAARAVGQVMAALKHSKNIAGPTMTDIVKFISGSLFKPATKRQVCTALKRGVEFGILKRKKGHYFISSPDESISNLKISPRKSTRTRVKQSAKLTDKVKKRNSTAVRSRRTRGYPGYSTPYYPDKSYELRNVYCNPKYRESTCSPAISLNDINRDDEEMDYYE